MKGSLLHTLSSVAFAALIVTPAAGVNITLPVSGSAASGAMATARSIEDFFPGNIFELRPLHVHVSSADEIVPFGHMKRFFRSAGPPPAAPAQDDILLTDRDSLTIVFPGSNGSFHTSFDPFFVDFNQVGSELELRVFQFLAPFLGNALEGKWEHVVPFGELPAGTYTLTIRQWIFDFRDFEKASNFDPESFDAATDLASPSSRWQSSDDGLTPIPVLGPDGVGTQPIETSVSFTVQPIPEPATHVLFALGALCLVAAGVRLRLREAEHAI